MNTIFQNLFIQAPASKVFKAVSHPAELVNWWPLTCKGQQQTGGEYNFFFGEPYNWFGEVSAYEIDKAFHIKMTKSDADWNPTTFGFDLEERDSGTYVRFSHKDWPASNDEFKNSAYCWALLLKALKDYIEQGVVVPFEERS